MNTPRFRGKEVSGIWNYVEFAYKVIPETVGQFTGLKDKNNKDIYEGDIIAKFDFEVPYLRSVVVRQLGAFGYMNCGDFIAFASNYHFNWDINSQSDKILVIGNIYDNPEINPKKYERGKEK